MVDFKYRDPLWERLFLEALKNTSFEGVTVSKVITIFLDNDEWYLMRLCGRVLLNYVVEQFSNRRNWFLSNNYKTILSIIFRFKVVVLSD